MPWIKAGGHTFRTEDVALIKDESGFPDTDGDPPRRPFTDRDMIYNVTVTLACGADFRLTGDDGKAVRDHLAAEFKPVPIPPPA